MLLNSWLIWSDGRTFDFLTTGKYKRGFKSRGGDFYYTFLFSAVPFLQTF